MIVVVRHCQSEYNVATDEQKLVANAVGIGHPLRDADLTPVGLTQADDTAQKIAKRFPKADKVYTSPLLRALRTAMPIAEALGADLIVTPVLREIRRDVSDVGTQIANLDKKFPDYEFERIPDTWWREAGCSCAELHECEICVSKRVALFHAMVGENQGQIFVSHSDFLFASTGMDLENGEYSAYFHGWGFVDKALRPQADQGCAEAASGAFTTK